MSLALQRRFRELLAQAQSVEGEDRDAAARIYLDCAKLMFTMAETTGDKSLKGDRIEQAERLISHAERLKRREPDRPTTTESPESPDAFHNYIREQVMQKSNEGLPSWEDIGGLEKVKELIKKSVVLGIVEDKPKAIEAWNTILFHGPPGTGKTLLAAAVAKNIQTTFFNVKISQMLSKYLGESPKIISSLFEVAREEAPAVVFIDEFDSMALSRGVDMHEETRRGLAILLTELDGLRSKASSKEFVLVIAATNAMDDIDAAILSRFGKKVEVPLPDFAACKQILKIHTDQKGIGLEDKSSYERLARYCSEQGLSGRAIRFLCTEAIWKMLDEMNPDLEKLAEEPYERIRKYQLKTRVLKERDFELRGI